MNIVLIGPYGAGKGTQAARLAAKYDLFHISTGDLFREHLQNRTELGIMIQDYLDQGELVPDSVATAVMEEWLRVCAENKGILFDGFPRTHQQAKFLEEIFIELSRSLDAVIYLKASDETVIKRLSEREVCHECHVPFHKTFNPFTVCPYQKCKGEHLTQRPDDTPEKVRLRLQIFHQETEPLVKYYQDIEKLVVVEGDKSIDQVGHAIMQSLNNRLRKR